MSKKPLPLNEAARTVLSGKQNLEEHMVEAPKLKEELVEAANVSYAGKSPVQGSPKRYIVNKELLTKVTSKKGVDFADGKGNIISSSDVFKSIASSSSRDAGSSKGSDRTWIFVNKKPVFMVKKQGMNDFALDVYKKAAKEAESLINSVSEKE